MSIITSTPTTICNSPLNLSKSKMLYSVPKASRMGIERKNLCSQAFYDLPPVKEKRSTSFGYGRKSDFTTSGQHNPSPSAYEIKSPIGGAQQKKGFSFGLSREQMAITGGFFVGEKKSPGPGAYDTRETLKTSISFSFRPRVNNIETTVKSVPGPGTYSAIQTLSPQGKLFVSKYQSASTTVISPARSRRFFSLKEGERPGPGTYDIGGELNRSGSYKISKLRSSLGRTFGLPLRSHTSAEAFKDSIPGPGAYQAPSEFGHYENKSSIVQHTVS